MIDPWLKYTERQKCEAVAKALGWRWYRCLYPLSQETKYRALLDSGGKELRSNGETWVPAT